MPISQLKRTQIEEWGMLRRALWPQIPLDEHRRDMTDILSDPEFNAVFVSIGRNRKLNGFVEISIRLTAEGCRPGPIGYLEGWYVAPEVRRKGIGGALVARAEAWALSKGCREMASDTEVENALSREAHIRHGYEQVSRLTHFRKDLRQE
jgi:aminoglycoside 6'-N-acetyltransferase I